MFTTLTAVTFHVMEREWSAELEPFTAHFSYWLSWQLILCINYLMFLDAEFLDKDAAIWLSVVLLLFNLALMGVIVQSAVAGIRKQQDKDKRLGSLYNQLLGGKSSRQESICWSLG